MTTEAVTVEITEIASVGSVRSVNIGSERGSGSGSGKGGSVKSVRRGSGSGSVRGGSVKSVRGGNGRGGSARGRTMTTTADTYAVEATAIPTKIATAICKSTSDLLFNRTWLILDQWSLPWTLGNCFAIAALSKESTLSQTCLLPLSLIHIDIVALAFVYCTRPFSENSITIAF